jgi:hypothetical protein
MNKPDGSIFYCDESGSAALGSEQQPYFVTGGVLADGDTQEKIRNYGLDLIRSNKWDELKGKQLARHPEVLVGILRTVQELGGEYFYVVAETRYSVVQKIVDVFMDPEHNDGASWLPIADDITREEVAAQLLRLPAATRKRFATVYQSPDHATWRATAESLHMQAKLMGWTRLAEAFAGAVRNMDTIVHHEDGANLRALGITQPRHFQFASINLPYFCHVVRLVDGVLEERSARGIVVHDQVDKFQRVFEWYFSALQRVPGTSFPWPSGIHRRNGITQLTRLIFEPSVEVVGLQVADLLCAGVRLAFSAPQSSELQRAFLPLLSPLFSNDLRFARISASPETKERLTAVFMKA